MEYVEYMKRQEQERAEALRLAAAAKAQGLK